MHLGQRRIKRLQGGAQSVIQSIDWAIAGGRSMFDARAHLDLYSRFAHRHQGSAMFIDHSESKQLEVWLMCASQLRHQEFEAGLRRLKLVPVVLQTLQLVKYTLLII